MLVANLESDIEVIVPLPEGTTIGNMQQMINKIRAVTTHCELGLVLPFGQSDSNGAIRIQGTCKKVKETRSMVGKELCTLNSKLYFDQLPDSPYAVAVAELASDESWSEPPCPSDIEEVFGDGNQIEIAHLRSIGDREKIHGIHVIEFKVPLFAAGWIVGYAGRSRLRKYLDSGVIIDIAGRISNGCDSCSIFLTAAEKQAIKDCKKQILGMISKIVAVERRIRVGEHIPDYLLACKYYELQKICQKYGSSLKLCSNELIVYGMRDDSVALTVKQVLQLTFDYHSVSVWLAPGEPSSSKKVLERIVIHSAVELGSQQSPNGTIVSLLGNQSKIEKALDALSRTCEILQIKYHLTQSEEIKDFISGKKDGKLIKIMKETGVSLSLQPSSLADQIDIELVGHASQYVIKALTMLAGEFPSETSFYISEAHHKRLIGHGGKTIQKVMKKYAVYIKFLDATEALEQVGMDVVGILPKGLLARLQNVIIRTPAKNASAVQQAKREILEMAEEHDSQLQEVELILSRRKLLLLTVEERGKLVEFIKVYSDSLDLRTISVPDDIMATHFKVQVVGYSAAINKFFAGLNDGGKMSKLFDKLCDPPEEISTDEKSPVMISPLLSPSSAFSTNSISSTYSWTASSPELFRHFNMSILQTLPESPAQHITTPLLSPIMNLSPMLDPITIDLKEFSPAVGSNRKGSWGLGFPKFPVVDAVIQGIGDEISHLVRKR